MATRQTPALNSGHAPREKISLEERGVLWLFE